MLRTINVSRCFATPSGQFWALHDINMAAPEGKLTILKGRSGSGKTTLMNILGALDKPTGGNVLLAGEDIVKLDERKRGLIRRKSIGYVFQSVALIPMMSAYENVEYALRLAGYKGDRRERASECLRMVGLAQRMNHMPQEMSGGEQQRVAIAIALANNPKILLADEPTGSVDVKTSNYLLDVFRKLNSELGLTIVIVTHDRMLAHKVNRVVSIRDGKTSSERIMHSYAKEMAELHGFDEGNDTHEEFAVLDRAGRLQIPREMLNQLGVEGNKVKLELQDDRIVIEKPVDPDKATVEDAVNAALEK